MRNVGHMKKYNESPTSSEMTQIETTCNEKGGEHFLPRDIDTEATKPECDSDHNQEMKRSCVRPTRV